MENIAIVLKGPKYAGNVGSVARAAKNMGIDKILVIDGREMLLEEMKQTSTHFAAELIDQIQYFDDLQQVLEGFEFIVGTTARLGAVRGPVVSPREMAKTLIDVSRHNRVALLFGPEDTGLSNDDLRLCHGLVTIPASEQLKSINLSHAVMILCYEIFTAQRGDLEIFTPRLATAAEIEGMYEQVKALLQKIGFLNPQNPEYWMLHIRRFFSRTRLFSREIKIIRGICRQLDWYLEKKQ
ncbi:MAG: rRNA methyltransferase [Syntrophus sp. (in: bacteria)]|nr:rRNA methyltransferase [Syntrophus sp. (in: bacteria)]